MEVLIDEEALEYFIKVWLDSVTKPIIIPVSKEEADRFEVSYDRGRDGFFLCETQRGTYVAMNLRHVQIANLLWERPGQTQLENSRAIDAEREDEDGENWISLYTRNRDPVMSSIGDPVELVDALYLMGLGSIDEGEILWFTDEDGELVMFDPAAILFLEAPTSLVSEGQKKMQERDGVAHEDAARRIRAARPTKPELKLVRFAPTNNGLTSSPV